MTRILNFRFVVGLLALLLGHGMSAVGQTAASSGPAKPKIGIMKFEVDPSLNTGLGSFLYNEFTDQVVKSGKFTVVDWEQLDRIQKVVAQAQPNVSPEDARKMAMHQLGIEKLYLGSLAKVGSKFYVGVKILSLDLTVERSERVSAGSEDEFERAIGQLADALLGGQKSVAASAAAPRQQDASAPAASGPAAFATKVKPFVNSLGMKFVPVPGTKVLFCIWETRVKDFEAFASETGYDATKDMLSLQRDGWQRRGDTWKKPGFTQGPAHPVCGVSWEDAKAFCKWLTERERRDKDLLPNRGYRLPTDAEWSAAVDLDEKVVGVPREKSGQIAGVYPWGSEWPPLANSGNFAGEEAQNADWPPNLPIIAGYSDGFPRTAPVGSFAPNRYGLYDLSGNVWEWCEDWKDRGQKYHTSRGGSWGTLEKIPASILLRSSQRGGGAPGYRSSDTGFRVVLVESPR